MGDANVFQAVFEHAPVPMLVVEQTGQIVAANAAARALLATAAGATNGPALQQLVELPDGVTVQGALANSARGAGTVRARIRGRPAGTGEFTMDWWSWPDAAGALRAICLRDTAELDAMARELNFARESAVAGPRHLAALVTHISHELRLPLNVVVGSADLMLASRLDDSQRRLTENMRLCAAFMGEMVSEVLGFSRFEAAEDYRLEALSFIPAETLAWVVRVLEERAVAKGLRLKSEVDALCSESLLGRAPWIRRVLMNLVGNAIKFTAEGEVRVRAECSVVDSTARRLRFIVTDTGEGIEADDLATLFEPFRQARAAGTGGELGSGLGLSICRRLVEAMGGQCGMESVPGQGTTAWFELELELAGREASPPEAAGTPFSMQDLDPRAGDAGGIHAERARDAPRVLVVEDNRLCREVLLEMLTHLGFRCDGAASGLEALHALANKEYDVAMVDCGLPDVSGCDLIRLLHSRSDLQHPAIIVTPGGGQERCVQRGIHATLPKPISMEALCGALQPWRVAPARTMPAKRAWPEGGAWESRAPSPAYVEAFTSDLNERLARISVAVASSDMESLRREVHAIASGSMQMGAVALVEKCAEITAQANDGRVESAMALADELRVLAAEQANRLAHALEAGKGHA